MKQRIRRIGVLKAGIVGGLIYAAMTLVFVPFMLFFIIFAPVSSGEMGGPEWLLGPAMLLLAPVFYGIFGFIASAIGAALYNLIGMMTGGLEIELDAVA